MSKICTECGKPMPPPMSGGTGYCRCMVIAEVLAEYELQTPTESK